MSDHDSNYGEDYYQSYADTFEYQRELDADEADHEAEARTDRLRRDWPVTTRLSEGDLVRLFVARGYDLSVARRMAAERKAA